MQTVPVDLVLGYLNFQLLSNQLETGAYTAWAHRTKNTLSWYTIVCPHHQHSQTTGLDKERMCTTEQPHASVQGFLSTDNVATAR